MTESIHLEIRDDGVITRKFAVANDGIEIHGHLPVPDLGLLVAPEVELRITDGVFNEIFSRHKGKLAAIQAEVVPPDLNRPGYHKIARGIGYITGKPENYHRDLTRLLREFQAVPIPPFSNN